MLWGCCLARFGVLCGSAFWCLVADTHLKLLDRAVSGDCFLTGSVFECNIAHRRSVAVLYMLYKIRNNSMHPFYGALPVPYVPVRVTRGALVAHRYTYAPPCWKPRSTAGLLIPFQYLCIIILLTLAVPDGVGLAGFKSRDNAFFYWPKLLFPFLFVLSTGWYCGAGAFGLIGCQSGSYGLALPTFFDNNKKIIM